MCDIREDGGSPLKCSCLENPRDGGAWWAAVYGVAQSRTRLKRLSSSMCDMYCITYNEWADKCFCYILLINITENHDHLSSILSDLNYSASCFIKLNTLYFMFPSNYHLSRSAVLHSFRQCDNKHVCVHIFAQVYFSCNQLHDQNMVFFFDIIFFFLLNIFHLRDYL